MLERNVGRAQSSMRHLHLASTVAGGVVGGALGAMVVSSVRAAASFDVTMRQIAVATNRPATAIAGLRQLALKMGQDTVFSAQDAGDAMLELAKGGLSEAQIRAGALASTLTLASAGGLQLGDAAGYIVQGLSTFNLNAKDSAAVAAALAGGANASTASVQDMGLALSQVGPGAKLAGLSLQETTAVLAAFAQNGIKGSDAGTSLKTMLARLVPQTVAQKEAMHKLGLSFVDSKGRFKDISVIAQLLHDRLGKLSDAQRSVVLNTIFGSDASRAAAVLMKEGAKGVNEYTRATSDKTQADKLAKATTEGMAGALSQLSGSVDTAKLQLGTALAPLVTDLANHMTGWANDVTTDVIPALARFIDGMEKGTGPGGQFVDVLAGLRDTAGDAWHAVHPMFSFIADHPDLFKEIAKDAALLAVAMKGMSVLKKIPGVGSVGGVSGAASVGRPLPVFVTNPGFGVGAGPGVAGPAGVAGTLRALGPLSIYAAAVNLKWDKAKVDALADDPVIRTILGLGPTDADKAATRADQFLDDPKRGRAFSIEKQRLIDNIVHPLDTAVERAKTLQALLTGMPDQVVVRLLSIPAGPGAPVGHHDPDFITPRLTPAPTPHPATITPAPRSTPATRDQSLRTGLTIHGGVTIQQLPGETTSGSFVRGLEHAAFLAGAG